MGETRESFICYGGNTQTNCPDYGALSNTEKTWLHLHGVLFEGHKTRFFRESIFCFVGKRDMDGYHHIIMAMVIIIIITIIIIIIIIKAGVLTEEKRDEKIAAETFFFPTLGVLFCLEG